MAHLQSQLFCSVNSIYVCYFSTLSITIPYDNLKSKLRDIISKCFFHMKENRRFQYVSLAYEEAFIAQGHSDRLQLPPPTTKKNILVQMF